ncbi:MAG: arylamine N-acetyltransferase [Deltaproteobacteria bacterium]|nr:arylamine N-acetyltransferase [Deltaproteobacteria bacterium]
MNKEVFALDPYLERLHYTGPVQATEDRLEALHRAQAYTIPFENFDILLGRGINLDPTALFDKLVRHQRGGYLSGLITSRTKNSSNFLDFCTKMSTRCHETRQLLL